jgi:hypothetical protein
MVPLNRGNPLNAGLIGFPEQGLASAMNGIRNGKKN